MTLFKSNIGLEYHLSSAIFVRGDFGTIYIDSYKLQLQVKSNIRRLTCHCNIYYYKSTKYSVAQSSIFIIEDSSEEITSRIRPGLYPQKFNDMKNGHLTPFLWDWSQKNKIGSDSIIYYFIFIQLQKLPEGCKKSINTYIFLINFFFSFFGTGPRKMTFLRLVPFLRDRSLFLRDQSLFWRTSSFFLFPRDRSLFLRDWFFFWGTGPASFGPVHWKQVPLHIVNSTCLSLVYLVNTSWVPN